MLNTRDFEYVIEIARQGSISKAAQALYITQPALSKFLQKTEAELGLALFYRSGKRFVLTPAGELYVSAAQQICRASGQLRLQLDAMSNSKNARIHIGTTASRMAYLTRAVLPEFLRLHPEVTISVELLQTTELLRRISTNTLDIILASVPAHLPNLRCEPVAEEELVLAVPVGSPLIDCAQPQPGARYPVIAPAQFAVQPFVMPQEGSYSAMLANAYFNKEKLTPRVVATLSDMRSVADAVAGGAGVSLFLSAPLTASHRIAYLSPEGCTLGRQEVCLVTRSDMPLNGAQNTLLQILRSTYRAEEAL